MLLWLEEPSHSPQSAFPLGPQFSHSATVPPCKFFSGSAVSASWWEGSVSAQSLNHHSDPAPRQSSEELLLLAGESHRSQGCRMASRLPTRRNRLPSCEMTPKYIECDVALRNCVSSIEGNNTLLERTLVVFLLCLLRSRCHCFARHDACISGSRNAVCGSFRRLRCGCVRYLNQTILVAIAS